MQSTAIFADPWSTASSAWTARCWWSQRTPPRCGAAFRPSRASRENFISARYDQGTIAARRIAACLQLLLNQMCLLCPVLSLQDCYSKQDFGLRKGPLCPPELRPPSSRVKAGTGKRDADIEDVDSDSEEQNRATTLKARKDAKAKAKAEAAAAGAQAASTSIVDAAKREVERARDALEEAEASLAEAEADADAAAKSGAADWSSFHFEEATSQHLRQIRTCTDLRSFTHAHINVTPGGITKIELGASRYYPSGQETQGTTQSAERGRAELRAGSGRVSLLMKARFVSAHVALVCYV